MGWHAWPSRLTANPNCIRLGRANKKREASAVINRYDDFRDAIMISSDSAIKDYSYKHKKKFFD